MVNERTRARIAARIKERAAYSVEFELSDPRAHFITITEVEVASDLSAAQIYYSVLGTESEKSQVKHMLQKAAGFVQRQVGRVLRTRNVPRLTFVYDERLENAARLDDLIQSALHHDREVNPEAHKELVTEELEVPPEAEFDSPNGDPSDPSETDER